MNNYLKNIFLFIFVFFFSTNLFANNFKIEIKKSHINLKNPPVECHYGNGYSVSICLGNVDYYWNGKKIYYNYTAGISNGGTGGSTTFGGYHYSIGKLETTIHHVDSIGNYDCYTKQICRTATSN